MTDTFDTWAIPPEFLAIVASGVLRPANEYADGEVKGPQLFEGRQMKNLRGATAFLFGTPIEGIKITTAADLESIPTGTVMRGEGSMHVILRAVGKNRRLFRTDPSGPPPEPIGQFEGSVFIEGLVAVSTLSALLSMPETRRGRASSSDA